MDGIRGTFRRTRRGNARGYAGFHLVDDAGDGARFVSFPGPVRGPGVGGGPDWVRAGRDVVARACVGKAEHGRECRSPFDMRAPTHYLGRVEGGVAS